MATKTRKRPAKPARKLAGAKVNISALARQLGVSRESLRNWKLEGINLADPKALSERTAMMHTGGGAGEPQKAARLRKTQLECRRIEMQIQRENENFVAWESVNQSATVFFSVLRSCFRELEGCLPEILNGLSAPQMGVEIKKAFFEVQDKLATERFMNNHPETKRLWKEFDRCDKLNLCHECRQPKTQDL